MALLETFANGTRLTRTGPGQYLPDPLGRWQKQGGRAHVYGPPGARLLFVSSPPTDGEGIKGEQVMVMAGPMEGGVFERRDNTWVFIGNFKHALRINHPPAAITPAGFQWQITAASDIPRGVYEWTGAVVRLIDSPESQHGIARLGPFGHKIKRLGTGRAIPAFGIPSGGTAGQFLVKRSDADYDTQWITHS